MLHLVLLSEVTAAFSRVRKGVLTHLHTHKHTHTHTHTQVDIFSCAMLLFELLTGQRPFESLTTTQELNAAVIKGERPLVSEGNADPAFPAMVDLMYDCWKHSSAERPNADEVGVMVTGILC